jgi:hypothetical protein
VRRGLSQSPPKSAAPPRLLGGARHPQGSSVGGWRGTEQASSCYEPTVGVARLARPIPQIGYWRTIDRRPPRNFYRMLKCGAPPGRRRQCLTQTQPNRSSGCRGSSRLPRQHGTTQHVSEALDARPLDTRPLLEIQGRGLHYAYARRRVDAEMAKQFPNATMPHQYGR